MSQWCLKSWTGGTSGATTLVSKLNMVSGIWSNWLTCVTIVATVHVHKCFNINTDHRCHHRGIMVVVYYYTKSYCLLICNCRICVVLLQHCFTSLLFNWKREESNQYITFATVHNDYIQKHFSMFSFKFPHTYSIWASKSDKTHPHAITSQIILSC